MDFKAYINAGYSLLWVQTTEEERALQELVQNVPAYRCFRWDQVTGLRTCSGDIIEEECLDPISLTEFIPPFEEKTIIFVFDFHAFFREITVVRHYKSLLTHLRANKKHIVFISHGLEIPEEMEKDITVFDFSMPSLESLLETAKDLVESNELNVEIDPKVISAAKGLTQAEAENAFARSIIETGKYSREILDQEKLQVIKKSGLMEIWNPEPIENVGGLAPLKRYIMNRKKGFTDPNLPTPKGILLAGVPGTGKSLSAKAIASVLNVPLIRLDLGTLKGGLVGESEANMKKATQMIDAIGDCIVWMDEVEKAMSGMGSSGQTDGGSSSNMLSQLLTWMQESTESHYIVATCNDIDGLLELSQGAFISRFDNMFFVDNPNSDEIKEIFDIICNQLKITDKEILNFDTSRLLGYTGREIRKILEGALYDGIEIAMDQVKPIAKQNKAVIEKARKWAQNNAILANEKKAVNNTGRKLAN